jgi:hypothetical protein
MNMGNKIKELYVRYIYLRFLKDCIYQRDRELSEIDKLLVI